MGLSGAPRCGHRFASGTCIVLPAGTAVRSTPMSSLAERNCPEVRARCFVSGLWLGQDFLCVSGAPLARWQGPCTVFKSGCTLLGDSFSALGIGMQPLACTWGWSGLRLVPVFCGSVRGVSSADVVIYIGPSSCTGRGLRFHICWCYPADVYPFFSGVSNDKPDVVQVL